MAEHERRDVDVALTVKALAWLLAAILVAAVIAWATLYFSGGQASRRGSQLPDQEAGFPEPRLRVDPLDEPAAYLREKAPKLTGVNEAMRRLEQSGWPPEREER